MNSAAISAKRARRPSAQRYSIATLRPSIHPSSRSRWTRASAQALCNEAVAEAQKSDGRQLSRLLRARRQRPRDRRAAEQRDELAPSQVGHQAPSHSPGRRRSVCRTSSLPQEGRKVLGADLNCSESRRRTACPRLSLPAPTLRERRHRGLARRPVAVRGAACVAVVTARPHPGGDPAARPRRERR